jgi:hypothetical protein
LQATGLEANCERLKIIGISRAATVNEFAASLKGRVEIVSWNDRLAWADIARERAWIWIRVKLMLNEGIS